MRRPELEVSSLARRCRGLDLRGGNLVGGLSEERSRLAAETKT